MTYRLHLGPSLDGLLCGTSRSSSIVAGDRWTPVLGTLLDLMAGGGFARWLWSDIRACPDCEALAGAAHPLSPAWCPLWNGWTPERLTARGPTARWAS